MKLPSAERALIDEHKVRGYLLSRSHPIGRFKAVFLARAGFEAENWSDLVSELRELAVQGDAVRGEESEFGEKYTISGTLKGPRGWSPPAHNRISEADVTFEALDTVVLTRDFPEQGLRAGDLGAVVEVYPSDSVEVEFVTASGRTTALVILRFTDVRPISDSDLVAVRSVSRTA